ncbi:GNAT family N-acetyltransferase [Deinococcus budaensis]|uniref:RimJ/RimL family protein N-acetyltransferase n=1 Tax=Deinococcus budaensis TaxID=1665626 RepID=A0A7W8GHM3_9DEIO|nr:GNAT family N-acetyltransferase [Deinococcus budaensis]MBB5235499.1 RimJ/RimL family protein N-acetyltransferase [Deinococcus budaensis]
MVRLERYDPRYTAELHALKLPDEQQEFTALPGEVLVNVAEDRQRMPVVITEGGQPVGFFVLSVGPHRDKYLPEPDPAGVALGALSVDERTQGRGIGTRAMQALPAFVRRAFPDAQHVLLVVNQRNERARRVYERAGFATVAERQGGKGPQWVMRLAL